MCGLQHEESRLGIMELGRVSLHALRSSAPQTGHTREQSQKPEHGLVVGGAGGEYEESGQREEQRHLQSQRREGGHPDRCG